MTHTQTYYTINGRTMTGDQILQLAMIEQQRAEAAEARAEAAEARAAALKTTCNDLHATNARLEAERDEARRELLAACNEVTDDITRLQWLQSLIHEAQKHADVLSDGDTDAAFTCFREVQALHDAFKAMVNSGVA